MMQKNIRKDVDSASSKGIVSQSEKAAKELLKRWLHSINAKNISAVNRALFATTAKRAVLVRTAHAKSETAAHLCK